MKNEKKRKKKKEKKEKKKKSYGMFLKECTIKKKHAIEKVKMGKKVVKGKNESVKRVIYKKLWKKKKYAYYKREKHAIEKRKK